MLKKPAKFKPKVAPRVPRLATKPALAGTATEKRTGSAVHERKETSQPTQVQPEKASIATSHPTERLSSSTSDTAEYSTLLPQNASKEQQLAPTHTVNGESRDNGSAPAAYTSHLSSTEAHALARPIVQEGQQTCVDNHADSQNPNAYEATPTPQLGLSATHAPPENAASSVAPTQNFRSKPSRVSRPIRAQGARRRRCAGTPTSTERNAQGSDNEDGELTIQEAIAINTAKTAAAEATKKLRGTSRPTSKRAPGTRKRKARVDCDEGNSEEGRTKRKRTSRKTKQNKQGGEGENSSPEGRATTPENGEEQTIDPTSLTLADLTRDLKIGRKFSKADEILRREKERNRKKTESRRARIQAIKEGRPIPNGEIENTDAAPGSRGQTPGNENATDGTDRNGDAETEEHHDGPSGPRFEIIDGQLVVDNSSLHINRHANTMNQNLPEVIEDDFSRVITSNSHMPASKQPLNRNPWTGDETALFFKCLRMFGTDFLTISKMFPHKSRRQIKLKFKREDRANPTAVNSALVGVKDERMDLELWKKLSRKELRSVEDIQAEHQAEMEDMERKEEERRKVVEEENRKKAEEVARKADEEGKKTKKRKKKGQGQGQEQEQGQGQGQGQVDDNTVRGGDGGETSGAAGEGIAQERAFGRISGRFQPAAQQALAFASRPRF